MTDETTEEYKPRADDRFMRRVIGILITTLLTVLIAAGSGFFVMYGELQSTATIARSNAIALNKYAEDYKTMVDIKVLVGQLVANSEGRNEKLDETNALLKKYSETQQYIFGEQKRRRPIINRAVKHFDDNRRHK